MTLVLVLRHIELAATHSAFYVTRLPETKIRRSCLAQMHGRCKHFVIARPKIGQGRISPGQERMAQREAHEEHKKEQK